MDGVPTVWLAKTRLAGRNVAVNAAGVVTVISLDLALSLAGRHAPPPVPLPLVELAKVKVDPVGWPVEVKVPLNAAILSPPMVTTVPVGKAQTAVQVTVAVVPLPLMLETIPPTNAVTV